MLGYVLNALQAFSYENGIEWGEIQNSSGDLPERFIAEQQYPDKLFLFVIEEIAKRKMCSQEDILEQFGRFIIPVFMNTFSTLYSPWWDFVEFLLRLDDSIHRVIQLRNPQTHPPFVKAFRIHHNFLHFEYFSERKLCSMIEGMLYRLSEEFHVKISVKKVSCMKEGAQLCTYYIHINQ